MGAFDKYITERSYERIKLLSGKSIGYHGWDVKQEKEFLFQLESKDDDDDFVTECCIQLMKSCIDSPEVFDNLSRADLLYLLMNMRKKSKGSKIEFSYYCTNNKCVDFKEYSKEDKEKTGREGQGMTANLSEIDLDSEDITIKNISNKPVKVGEKYKFFFKDISYSEQRKLEEKYIEKDQQLKKFLYNFILNSIKKVEIGEDKIDNFTTEDLNDLVESLSAGEYEELSKGIKNRMSKFIISKKVQCPLCEDKSTVMYDNLFSILVF